MKKDMTRDMTQGRPIGHILAFFFLVLLGDMFQQLYNMVDSVIVGRFVSTQALAAVGSTGSLSFLVIGIATGLCNGFGVSIAKSFGGKDEGKLRQYIANSIWLGAGLSLLLTSVALFFCDTMLHWMNTPADMYREAKSYISIIFGGIAVTFFYNLLAAIARGLGDSRTPLLFLIAASALNILLDLFFVLLFHWGTAGVAWATVLAQLFSGLGCLVYMLKGFPILRLKREHMRPSLPVMGRLLHMGVPMAVQMSIISIGLVTVQAAVNAFGSAVIAAVTAASKVQTLLLQPMCALSPTMASYCSQNLGAGELGRIRCGVRQSLLVSMACCVLMCGLGCLAGTGLSELFLRESSPEITAAIRQYMVLNCVFFPFHGSLVLIRSAVQGLGYAVPAMAAGVLEMAARSLMATVAAGIWGFPAVCLASPAAWFAADLFVIPMYFYARKHCLKNRGTDSTIEIEKECTA